MSKEENLGEITIKVTEDKISYDSDLDIPSIILFLELTKKLILDEQTKSR